MKDIESSIHDEVFMHSIDRKERLTRFIISRLSIPELYVRDEITLIGILEQLLREQNPIIEAMEEDIMIFLNEYSSDNEADTRGVKNDNSFYDRNRAKIYIDTYWKNYNANYPAFNYAGGDCANFVSQILYAGGMPWKDDGMPSHYTWYTNWYCKGGATNKDGDKRISLSWKVAAAFKNHWQKRAEKSMMYSYAQVINDINEIAKQIYIADVVQFCYSNGVPWHTLAVTGFAIDLQSGKTDIVLASHTRDSNSRSLLNTLLNYPADYKLRIYIIKDSQ